MRFTMTRLALCLPDSFGLIATGEITGMGRARGSTGNKAGLRRICGVLAGLLVLCGATSVAQIVAPSDTIASPIPGVGHSYIKMLNETVNPENGAVNLSIAIPTPPGRQLNFPFSIQYNSNQALFLAPAYILPFGLAWFSGVAEFDSGAWSYSVPNLSRKPYVFNVYWAGQLPSGQTPDESMKCGVMDSYTFTAPDGSQNALPLAHIYDNVDTSYAQGQGQGFDYACANAVPHLSESDTASGGLYQAVLAGLYPVPDCCAANPPEPDDGIPTIAGPDGTVYMFSGLDPACSELSEYCFGNPPYEIEDRNGNIVQLQAAYARGTGRYSLNVTDTAGRTLVNAPNFGQSGSTISVSGDSEPYTLNWETFTYSGYSLSTQNESTLPQYCSTQSSISTGSQKENVLSAVTLPNGESYTFTYDAKYGLISKITYPSGGYVRYVYGVDPISSNVNFNANTGGDTGTVVAPGACDFRTDAIAVTDRYVSFNGTTEVQHQHFAYGATTWGNGGAAVWNTKSTTVTTYDLVLGTNYTTAYNYVGQLMESGVNYPNTYPVGVEASVTTSQGSATLKSVAQGWQGPTILDCEVDTLGGVSSAKYYSHGAGNQITDIKEFDYSSGDPFTCASTVNQTNAYLLSPAGWSRETAINYQSFGPTLFPNVPSLFDRPCSIQSKDGSGAVKAETDYFYDGGSGSTPCGALGSSSTSPVPGGLPPGTHDGDAGGSGGAFTSSSTIPRGNATKFVKRCLYGCSTDSTTTVSYDETGQVTSITEPCGNASCPDMTGTSRTTSYSYEDSPSGGNGAGNSNAYLTSITFPTGSTERFAYNYPSGELSESTDENSFTTIYYYNDPFNRPTEISYPDSGVTMIGYTDTAPNPTVTTCKLLGNTDTGTSCPVPGAPSGVWEVSTATMDGLGHSVQTKLASDPVNPDFTNTIYDGEGRVYQQSNPTRCSSSPGSMPGSCPSESTWGVATFVNDALGRKTTQYNPDGSTEQWLYNGNAVTFTNELSNSWTDVDDAFGNTTQVTEPGGFNTTYQYNVLNDLLCADQWASGTVGSHCASTHSRQFSYDSISRLYSALNPESGTTSYAYDVNGNVVTKTDARTCAANFTYDARNRTTLKSYGTCNGISPPSDYFIYDNPTVYYNSSNQFALANTMGRLSIVCQWNGTGCAAQDAFTYDSMGRIKEKWTSTPNFNAGGPVYNQRYNYDPAGNATDIWYPDLRHVTLSWNGAEEISNVTFADFNGSSANYPYLSSASYFPDGSVQSMTFGNGMQEAYSKNNRLQDSEIKVTGDQSQFNGQRFFDRTYSYVSVCGGSSGNAGNISEITDSLAPNPSTAGTTQIFCYDPLNRIASFATADNGVTGKETYSIDAFGNNSEVGPGTYQNNLSFNSNNRISSSGYSYDAAGNMTGYPNPAGGTNTLTYDADSRIVNWNGSAALYTYDGDGERVRKDVAGGWTEYIHADGQPLAQVDNLNNWQDSIYANGRRIASAGTADRAIVLQATFSGTEQSASWALPFSPYAVQSGDVIGVRETQAFGAVGGLHIVFNDGTNADNLADSNGQPLAADGNQSGGHWQLRTFNLGSYAGKTIESMAIVVGPSTPAGSWVFEIAKASIVSTTGKVTQIYNQAPSIGLSYSGTSGVTSPSSSIGTYGGDQLQTAAVTNYYTGDQIGSTRLEVGGEGWPVSADSYDPFGRELTTVSTLNNYKFTGKERDAESGNDDFGARYYASTIARFMSPDWSGTVEAVPYAKLDDPQTLNLYAYVENNPTTGIDADGHFGPIYSHGSSADDACNEGVISECTGGTPEPTSNGSQNTQAQAQQQNITGFLTIDQAGAAALTVINPASIKENQEYSGHIYEDASGKYHYTDAVPGTEEHSNPGKSPAPKGTTVVGDYHTHGDYSIQNKDGTVTRTSNPKKDNLNSDHFSPRDIKVTNSLADAYNNPNYRSYLGTPSGQFKRYDLNTGKEIVVR
jgi:RHS repeat-associated protein